MLARRKAQTGQEQPPFATVVTDLTSCHPTWFHKGVTTCFVPTQEARSDRETHGFPRARWRHSADAFAQHPGGLRFPPVSPLSPFLYPIQHVERLAHSSRALYNTKPQVKDLAMAIGLVEQQIRMYGLPIRPSFSQPLPPKAALRKSLGMKPNGHAVLIVGGGEGMGQLEPTATALAKVLGSESQLVVICGRNLKLAKELQERKWPFPIYVKGARSAGRGCPCCFSRAGFASP